MSSITTQPLQEVEWLAHVNLLIVLVGDFVHFNWSS